MEGESNIGRVSGSRLRTTLLFKIRLLTVSVEEEHLDNMADHGNRQRTLSDYAQSSSVCPPVTTNNFELKPVFVQVVQQSAQFHGLLDKDPNSHITGFLKVCDTLKINNVSNDATRLGLFPFSLKGRAK